MADAEDVLAGVQACADGLGVERAWVEGERVLCVIYENEFTPGRIGLRRAIEPDVDLNDVLEQILDFDMGEPLGLFESYLVADADGLRWWKGDPPEMRSYFTKQSRASRQASTRLYEQT